MANTTKRMLAMALQSLLAKTTLDKITVQDIVDEAEVSRKTFYYHFQDIYDLMEWMLMEGYKRMVPQPISNENWTDELVNILVHLQKNRDLVLNVYHSIQRETLENVLMRLLSPLIEENFMLEPGYEQIGREDRQFVVDFLSFGLCGMFLRWIGNGLPDDYQATIDLINRLYNGMVADIVQRCRR